MIAPRPVAGRSSQALSIRFPARRAFITGAANGLGLEFARLLAADGWSVGLFDINTERLNAAEAELSAVQASVQAFPGDVTQADELTVAVNSFAEAGDGLDLMINNAGVACAGGLMETPLADWRWVMDVNVLGVVNGCKAGVPHLQRGGGILLNVASVAAFVSLPHLAPFSASQAAVLSLTETLAAEVGGNGIQVCAALPTVFQSGLLESLRAPAAERTAAEKAMRNSPYTARAAAEDILRAVADGKACVVLPREARGWWYYKRILPGRLLNSLRRFRDRLPA